MTIEQMIKSIPLRPVGIVERELLKLNGAYNPTLLILKQDKEGITQRNALKKSNPRYNALLSLNAALGEPKASIKQVQVKDFDVVLRELCRETKAHIERGWEKLRGDRVQKLMDQILFLDLQRQEMVWRLAYWDQVEAIAGWIVGLHDTALTDMLSDVAVYVPETPEEFLSRRERKTTLERVNRHRGKHKGTSDASEQCFLNSNASKEGQALLFYSAHGSATFGAAVNLREEKPTARVSPHCNEHTGPKARALPVTKTNWFAPRCR